MNGNIHGGGGGGGVGGGGAQHLQRKKCLLDIFFPFRVSTPHPPKSLLKRLCCSESTQEVTKALYLCGKKKKKKKKETKEKKNIATLTLLHSKWPKLYGATELTVIS